MIWQILISLIVGCVGTQLILRPRLHVTQQINQQVKKENEENLALKTRLTTEVEGLEAQKSKCQHDINDINLNILQAQTNLSGLNDLLKENTAAIDETTKKYEEQALESLSDHMDAAAEKERLKYLDAITSYRAEQESVLATLAEELRVTTETDEATITALKEDIEILRKKVLAINEANKRVEEDKDKINFYKLQISDWDKEEIVKLRDLGKVLRDSTPLNKLIWTYYFRTPYNDLCGRVVGPTAKTGIYKITNTIDGKVYIGQAVNIKNRWGDHIKMGLGADTPTRSKLYVAMAADGVENFTFEILEECPANQLNEREKFYIEFYDSNNYGQNSTRGGS